MVNTSEMTKELIHELAFSKEDQEEIAKSRTMPITFDEDCPETTPERALKFRRVNPPRNNMKKSIAIKPQKCLLELPEGIFSTGH